MLYAKVFAGFVLVSALALLYRGVEHKMANDTVQVHRVMQFK